MKHASLSWSGNLPIYKALTFWIPKSQHTHTFIIQPIFTVAIGDSVLFIQQSKDFLSSGEFQRLTFWFERCTLKKFYSNYTYSNCKSWTRKCVQPSHLPNEDGEAQSHTGHLAGLGVQHKWNSRCRLLFAKYYQR